MTVNLRRASLVLEGCGGTYLHSTRLANKPWREKLRGNWVWGACPNSLRDSVVGQCFFCDIYAMFVYEIIFWKIIFLNYFFVCLTLEKLVNKKTLFNQRKIWFGFQESVFLENLDGKLFSEIVKNLKMSYYLLIISNLILKLLIAIYILFWIFIFQFHLLKFNFYINFGPHFYNCYLFFSYHFFLKFFIYQIWPLFFWLLLIFLEIIYEMLIIIILISSSFIFFFF